jgi:signal transduction histidine kinase
LGEVAEFAIIAHTSAMSSVSSSIRRPQARLTAVRRVQRALAGLPDIETLFRMLHAELGCVMDTTGFLLGLFDEASQMVQIVGQMEAGRELPGGSFPLGTGFLSEVIRKRQPRLIRHWSVEGPRVSVQYATNTPGLPESTVTVPLLVGGGVVGVLSVQSYATDSYDDDDLFMLERVAAQVALAIDSMRRGLASQALGRASKLEAVVAGMTDGLLILDAAGRIDSLNPPARAIFDSMGVAIILGQPLDHEQWGQWPLGAKVVAEALGPVLSALQRGEAQRDIDVEVNAHGRRVLSFSSAPITDSSANFAGGVVVIRDVTTQRDVARLRDDLLSIASHDLRTPATVLRIQAQMMQRELKQSAQESGRLADRVQMMLDQTDRLSNMLNLLLDLSRVEAGRLDLRREPTDLVHALERVITSIQSISERHTIRLCAPEQVEGNWDAARLDQVIQNLLTNAIKYSPDGGEIGIRVTQAAGLVTVAVRDQGLGIAADELDQVFSRFYRVARTRGLEGSGLGLYVCQGIIAAHGGRIWATSDGPGHGSTFSFTLPQRAAPALPHVA